MKNPKVSILIPLYNSEKYISETIQSCLNQTYNNIEIVIVDDGSTDKSTELVKSFKKENILLWQQENKGACVARNKAFELSSGEYIQYLDADDLLEENKIEEQMKLVDENNLKVLLSGKWDRFYKTIEGCSFSERKNYKSYNNPTDWFVDTWGGREMSQTSAWLTHSKLIIKSGGWNETLKVNQDGEFFTRIILLSHKIHFVELSKIYYRSGLQNNVSNPREDNVKSLFKSLTLNEKNVLRIRNDEAIRNVLAIKYAEFIYRFHPKYKTLTNFAFKRIKYLNIKVKLNPGGKNFNKISKIVGFKTTLKIRALFIK